MGKLENKKLILLGDAGGVSGEALEACLAKSGASVVMSVTVCSCCSAVKDMEPRTQSAVKETAEKYGPENCVVIIGSGDAEQSALFAESVTEGNPSFAGALADVGLKLPVYHVFEEEIRAECGAKEWKEHVATLDMFLDKEALVAAVKEKREHCGANI